MATVNQIRMLKLIAESEFNGVDGGIPSEFLDAHTWIDCVVSTPSEKGVYVSLVNAGLVESYDHETVNLTEKGFKIYLDSLNSI